MELLQRTDIGDSSGADIGIAESTAAQGAPGFGLPAGLLRGDEYLHQRPFHAYRSETQLMKMGECSRRKITRLIEA